MYLVISEVAGMHEDDDQDVDGCVGGYQIWGAYEDSTDAIARAEEVWPEAQRGWSEVIGDIGIVEVRMGPYEKCMPDTWFKGSEWFTWDDVITNLRASADGL